MKPKGTVGTSLTKVKEAILFRRFLSASVVGMAIFVMAFVLVPYIMAEANAAETASVGVSWNEVSLTLDPDYGNGSIGDTGHGDVNFGEIVPTSVGGGNIGTMRVIKKNIGVITNGTYYSVYLGMNGSDQELIMTDTGLKINPINAYWDGDGTTKNAPSAFSSTAWGFAVPTGDGVDTLETPFTYNYSANYDSVLGTDLTKTTHSSIYNTATWAQVPAEGDEQQIWKEECVTTQTRNCNSTGFGTAEFPVYYGIMVDTDTMAGTYENEIIYTAMASASSLDTVSNNVSRDKELVKEGTIESLSIDLSSSGVPLTRSDVEVYLVPHSVAAAVTDTIPASFENNYRNNAHKCTIGTGENDFVPTSHGLALNCTLPASPNGIDDGKAATATAETTSGEQLGEFDIWIHVDTYGYDYISKYTRNVGLTTKDVAAIVYAGLQSKDEDGNTYVTKMQEMTKAVCENTNKWGTGLGTAARIYDYSGTGTALADNMNDSMEIGLGTYALTDTRDSKQYLVRRLADGNCWMVQNMDFDLAGYSSSNKVPAAESDLTADWDPYESTNTKITSTYASQLSNAGLTSDFAGLMTWMNNTTNQTQQYQNSTQYKWYWGVRRTSADTDYTTLSGDARNNAFSQIPRTYDNTVYGTNNVRYVAMDISTGKTYKAVNTSSTTSGWTEGMTDNNETVATTTSGLTPTAKLTTPGADASDATDDVWNFYGSMYIGKYYNWYAATAETGTYNMSSVTAAGSQASSSICPKGWELPYDYDYVAGRGNSWYNLLITNYGLTVVTADGSADTENSMKVRQAPLSLPLSGSYYWTNGNLNVRGYYGIFWSRSASSNSLARYLYFNTVGRVNPQDYNNKVNGFTVRCVAK